jgi:hypothetical protein
MAFCSGSYLARPKEFLILDLDVFLGTGTLMTTCVAKSFSEKLAITLRLMVHLRQRLISNAIEERQTEARNMQLLTWSVPPPEPQESTEKAN